jgi:RHS repeat-associated protein
VEATLRRQSAPLGLAQSPGVDKNAGGLPVTLQQRVSAESIYNSDGTLFVRNKDGALIAENPLYWNTSSVTEYIYLNGTPVAVATGPTNLSYIYPDHLDTPRAVVNAANNIVWRWDSTDPFGSLPADGNPSGLGSFTFNLRFPGQYFSQETGLHYNFFRDYDSQTGRYVESDPVGLAAGINTYGYTKQNPVSRSDPDGQGIELGIIIIPVAAVVGGLYCYKKGLDKCEKRYPNHKNREHPDFVGFIQCATGVAHVISLGIGITAEPISGGASATGEAISHEFCSTCKDGDSK